MPDEFEFKSRLVGSLNTLKNIWPSVKKHYILFQGDMIKMVWNLYETVIVMFFYRF